MSGLVLQSSEIFEQSKGVGTKSKHLALMLKLGLNVPDFLAIPASSLTELVQNDKIISATEFLHTKLYNDLVTNMAELTWAPDTRLAVRSSALIEDQSGSAMAGQFLTVTDLAGADFGPALLKIVRHAYKKLNKDLMKFSVIVQRYVEADFSGVVFTRNPNRSREMVVEYNKGACEAVVSGKIRPQSFYCNWNELKDLKQSLKNTELKAYSEVIVKGLRQAQKLETHFSHPQDIEWLIHDNEWYFLQSRDISTIKKSEYEQIRHLEQILPKSGFFYYEKSEISEVMPRPLPLELSIIKKLFANTGPIAKVYRQNKINYQAETLFKLIGNELFIDKEAELKSLLPALKYDQTTLQPSFKFSGFNFNQINTTLKNLYAIGFASVQPIEITILYIATSGRIADFFKERSANTLQELCADFYRDYQLIFGINYLAKKTIKDLEAFLKTITKNNPARDINVAKLLKLDTKKPGIVQLQPALLLLKQNKVTGNSISLLDTSDFQATTGLEKEFLVSISPLGRFIRQLPEFSKNLLFDKIYRAQQGSELRELGRYLTVASIDRIRKHLKKIARFKNVSDYRNLLYLNLKEVQSIENEPGNFNSWNQLLETCATRKLAHQDFKNWQLPKSICSHAFGLATQASESLMGVSAGTAKGVLTSKISGTQTHKPILYTENLSPELVEYFSSISGIVSKEGGMLSHLAIMAREYGIPVIVGVDLASQGIKLGQVVKIDGAKGTIA